MNRTTKDTKITKETESRVQAAGKVPVPEEADTVARNVVDAAFKVHRALGPGLLESVYESCLGRELQLRGIEFERQRPIPVHYEGLDLDQGFRIDLFVADSVVVEIKAVNKLQPIHEAQILTYLKLSKVRVGLLINFNVRLFKEGVRRFVV